MLLCWAALDCEPEEEATEPVEPPAARDLPAEPLGGWEFDEGADLQNPELPTGCEATAVSTLLRMHGIEASKEEVADAMPRSDGEDFVNAFWGDPRSGSGWACMSPCAAATARAFLPEGARAEAVRGAPLEDLPAPFVAWVTIGLEDPEPSDREQDGYALLVNTHAVTVVEVGGGEVACVDPLEGEVRWPLARFEAAYAANGSQAVYLALD